MPFVYVLRLRNGRFFVGRTSFDPRECLEDHKGGRNGNAEWARRWGALTFKTIFVVSTEDEAIGAEIRITCELMLSHGVNLARGGSFLDNRDYGADDVDTIANIISSVLNKSFVEVAQCVHIQLESQKFGFEHLDCESRNGSLRQEVELSAW